MTYKEEAYLLSIISENNEILHQIIGVLNNLIVKHNQENDEDFTRNVVANLVSEGFNRYKK